MPFSWKVYSSTGAPAPPSSSSHRALAFLSFLLAEVYWMGGQVEKRRGPWPHKKNVQISHLVVFMLRAPCGPWRCWKHGKHRRDQSNLISIRSELEWPGCMARPSPVSGPETAASSSSFLAAAAAAPSEPSASLCLCVLSRFFFSVSGLLS